MNTTFFKRAAYAALISGMFLTSCSDDVIDDVKGGTDETQYEKGYVSFSFVNTTAVAGDTRADGDNEGDLVGGTTNESKLSSAIVVLYTANETDEKDNTVAYQFELKEEGTNDNGIKDKNGVDGGVGNKNEKRYTTEAQEVLKKTYKVAVFLNPSDALITATKPKHKDSNDADVAAKKVSDMRAAITLDYNTATNTTGSIGVVDLIGTDENKFLMSNFAGLINVKESDIKSTKSAAESAPVSLYVERAVAKLAVSLGVDDLSKLNTDMHISSINWHPDVLAKKTFWMREQTNRLKEDDKSEIAEEVGISPVFRQYMYAGSPYFDNTSLASYNVSSAGFTGQPTAPTNRYTYIAATNVTKAFALLGADPTIMYVPENTMRAIEQYEDVTTSIVVKAVLNPKKTSLGANLAANSSYFVYKSWVFSHDEINDVYADNYSGKAGEWAKVEKQNLELDGFQKLIQETDAETALGGAAKDYAAEPAASAKYKGIAFYKGGVNYYNVPIRHFGEGTQPQSMAYGRYGVVRNNVYKLTLNSINSYGDIDIPTKDYPDDKLAYLSVQFQILPWIVRAQGIDL